MVGYEDLDAPLLVASADAGDLEAEWAELVASAVDLERLGDAAEPIPGFDSFNDPRIALSDGRFVVRGRWDGDEPVAIKVQRHPDVVGEGEDNPITETLLPPVRLFVWDPAGGEMLPVSHIPDVFPFSTAMSVGESPDVVLDVVVLQGEQVLAYVSGFSGAAYDLPREVYVAPIPSP